jgi:hypothetical protein
VLLHVLQLNDAHMFYMPTPPPSPSSPTRVTAHASSSFSHHQPMFSARLADAADKAQANTSLVGGKGSRLRSCGAAVALNGVSDECAAGAREAGDDFPPHSPLSDRRRSQESWHNGTSEAQLRGHETTECLKLPRSSSAPDMMDAVQVPIHPTHTHSHIFCVPHTRHSVVKRITLCCCLSI